jgi:hypothetical protein|tara:strand:+ start:182 stop:394 length:213 start_codon:yes stop_codon:yes gene_type:complete
MNKPKECPKCKSKKVMEILYGYPDPSYKIPDDVYLGGCCLTEEDYRWHCDGCDWEWGSEFEGSYKKLDEE